ncbi:MAG TPA: helix-turn-helix transcriptional regulator, partial [Paracoccaceae bacterium]|nr:helix-turn-helix transcriptional regulator [Paracoccaceae bacterium]
MARTVIGTRIRERRRQLGMTQAGLARQVGISASYMNLIERNRRAIAGPLLRRTAEALSLRLEELDGAVERRLLEMLDEISHAPELAALGPEADAAGDLIARYPGWARALAALARSEREASSAARALADRLGHDPFLAEALHRMLTRIAAIRSAAEIIGDVPDLPGDQRARFDRMIREESRGLSDVGEALAEYFDRAAEPRRALTPLDEAEALFETRRNRFARIEDAAAALSGQLGGAAATARLAGARALAEERLGPGIDAILTDAAEVETTQGLARARRALLDHAAAAILAPMPALAPQAAALRYDVEALAEHFAVDPGTVCLRLTSLPEGDHPR